MSEAIFSCARRAASRALCAFSTAFCRRSRSLTLNGLFLRAFALAAFLLLLEGDRGLPVGRMVLGPLRMLLRLWPHRPAACLLRNVVAGEIGRQLGLLFERPAGADGTLQNDARRSHGRRDDVGILALLRRALVKEIAV